MKEPKPNKHVTTDVAAFLKCQREEQGKREKEMPLQGPAAESETLDIERPNDPLVDRLFKDLQRQNQQLLADNDMIRKEQLRLIAQVNNLYNLNKPCSRFHGVNRPEKLPNNCLFFV